MFSVLYDSDVPEIKNLKTLGEVRDYIDLYLQNTDLDIKNPPYTSQIYHPMRKNIIQNYQPLLNAQTQEERNLILYKLTQIIDEEMLNMFQLLLARPYSELIMIRHYGIPKDIDVDTAQKQTNTFQAIQTLVSTIAEWNIQIERTVDSIQKIKFYKLWVPSVKLSQIRLTTELKALLSPDNDFSYKEFSKNLMFHLLAEGVNKFGEFIKTHALSDSNLTFGAVLFIYQAFVGPAAMPWPVIMKQIDLRMLFGGLLGSLALGKISTFINSTCEVNQILDCAKVFREISFSLVDFNERISEAVNDCLLCMDEEDGIQKRNS